MDTQKHLFDNKKMAALLIPLAIDQLLNSFMGTVDTLVVSNRKICSLFLHNRNYGCILRTYLIKMI